MKHEQLQIAAKGIVAKVDRYEVAQKLQLMKQKEHKPTSFQCSWPYFAGFFDAEGSISIERRFVGIHLRVGQMNPFVLHQLKEFLHRHNLKHWKLSQEAQGAHRLECSHLATCKLTLQNLLDHGLDAKQMQATFALSLTPENHSEVRHAILRLNGFNNKYQRLDYEGVARAKEIQKVSRQLHRASFEDNHSLLQKRVKQLREEHVLQNLITKCQRLRRDMRISLREGGLVRSGINRAAEG